MYRFGIRPPGSDYRMVPPLVGPEIRFLAYAHLLPHRGALRPYHLARNFHRLHYFRFHFQSTPALAGVIDRGGNPLGCLPFDLL